MDIEQARELADEIMDKLRALNSWALNADAIAANQRKLDAIASMCDEALTDLRQIGFIFDQAEEAHDDLTRLREQWVEKADPELRDHIYGLNDVQFERAVRIAMHRAEPSKYPHPGYTRT